jgi:hypothetical protein
MIRLFTAAVLASACLWASPAQAAMSYDNCTNFVATLPATISTQGTWCLNKDLATAITAGSAITIATNNVTLDCNDFKLGGLAAGMATRTVGVMASGRTNITVRNCAIRGFYKGIQLNDGASAGHLIEGNRLDGNTWIGIDVGGDGSVVRGNRLTNTGGGTGIVNAIKALGIYSYGDVEILGNLINGVIPAAGSNGQAMGINPGFNLVGSVIDNNIKNVIADGGAYSYGILFHGTTGRVSVDSNNIVGPGNATSVGVYCPAGNKIVLAGNVASGWNEAQVACHFDGGNVVVP